MQGVFFPAPKPVIGPLSEARLEALQKQWLASVGREPTPEELAKELEAKVKEISRGLSQQGNIDPERLRLAVADDLLRDKLLEWLEANSTITETAAGESSDDAEGSKTKAKADQKAEKKAKKGAGKEG